jgi:hypothetical protein
MKNIIYSIYIENNEPNLSEKHQFTKTQLKKHYQRLVDVKKEYAKHCNAEYRVYGNDTYYQKFRKKFDGFEFDIINLYKIYLWEELGKEYDNVLYLDLDVIPNTTESFFEKFDMNKICVHAPNATMDIWSQKDRKNYKKGKVDFETIVSHKDKYDMYVKAICKKAMLAIDNKYDTDYLIANTAILGGNSNAIKKLKYTERLNKTIDVLNKAKEEKFFGEEISKLFFANNEIFVHYLLDKDNIDWYNLPKEWHTYLMKKDEITTDIKSAKMIHLINKRFEELWTILK